MAGPLELDESQRSFPAYADLTQTVGWNKRDVRIRADTNQATEAVELSQTKRYTEGAVLGTGGMGKVVLARDERIGREVAVKVLHADRELDPDDRARFLREAQVQGQLEHPSIVPVYDIERRPDGSTFFTMRRVLGRTLSAILDDLRKGVPAAKTRYTQRELLTAFATVCLAVDYAHTRGVVHRDLKPANIMLGDFGEVYVLDWGLARLVDDGGPVEEPDARISMPGTFLGTPLYMAPEQMADPAVTPAADVYSLGLILFELLTLERARDPNSVYTPVDARPSIRTPYRNVAPELETICVKAVEADPVDRHASARAMQEAINRYLEGDREIEQRQSLAAQHMTTARIALGTATAQSGAEAEKQRGIAMSELARAVSLDPTNNENVALLADIMANPPPDVPQAVEAELALEDHRIMRLGAQQAVLAMGMWVLAFPLLLAMGFSQAWQASLIAVPVAVTAVLCFLMLRQREVGWWLQYSGVAGLMLAAAMVSRIFGPFMLVPTIMAANSIVMQTHSKRSVRRFSVIIACVMMVAAIAVEWTGIAPSSYRIEGGVWTIVPQLVDLSRVPTFVFMTIVSLALILVPSAFISRLRKDLSAAQVRLAVQAWHFKRLGAQLIGERTR